MRRSRVAAVMVALCAALVTPIAGTLGVSAQSEPPAAVQAIHAFQDAWNSGRVERVLPLFADDAVVVDSRDGAPHTGRDAVHRWLAAQLSQETHIVAGWGYEAAGGAVRW